MLFSAKVVLAVGAHPDDIELGCGGTLCQAVKSGARVIAIFMTKGELSAPPEVRQLESTNALSILGIKHINFGDFPDSEIPQSRKAIDFLETFALDNKADVILTHSVNDNHQDHRQTAWLSISAFRNVSRILSYETPRVTSNFAPNYFVDVSGSIDLKWQALQCHLSQKKKRYLAYESMVNLASFRGSQVGLQEAEAFEVVRLVD